MVAALERERPLGVRKLLPAVRKHGIRGGTDKLKDWLVTLAQDPGSNLIQTGDGYDLGGVAIDPGYTPGHGDRPCVTTAPPLGGAGHGVTGGNHEIRSRPPEAPLATEEEERYVERVLRMDDDRKDG